tara:strand:+ start:404 stop:736 length:333 start_codon:yes stop_codon:yes gene_type:complete
MKLTKDTLKQLIQETIQENEGRSWDEDEPTNTPQARAKDNLQTAMLDAAQTFLAQHFADVEDEKVKEETIYNTYSELETILVDAMMGWNLPPESGGANQWRYAGKGDPLL